MPSLKSIHCKAVKMLVIKEQRHTLYEERPIPDGGGGQPHWNPISDNCAKDAEAKGWVMNLASFSL